jgi:hypothetical protein
MSDDLIFLKAAAWLTLAFLVLWPGELAPRNRGTGRHEVITDPPA